ncbi:MAG: hypothetical protein QOH59_1114 [Gemmatimonadales bacterium]|nr:hypothetical protein [Gemmatimonadales bacterium]
MRVHSSTRFAAMAALVGALACAGNTARDTDTDEAAAARDTTTTDTLGGQNPPGYRGMERDTTIAPPSEQQPSDTFLQKQGTGTPQDTSGYSGAERVDTTGQANQQGQTDTTSFRTDTTGAAGAAGAAGDTTSMTRDSSWTKAGDTTGYNPTQQPGDSVSR